MTEWRVRLVSLPLTLVRGLARAEPKESAQLPERALTGLLCLTMPRTLSASDELAYDYLTANTVANLRYHANHKIFFFDVIGLHSVAILENFACSHISTSTAIIAPVESYFRGLTGVDKFLQRSVPALFLRYLRLDVGYLNRHIR